MAGRETPSVDDVLVLLKNDPGASVFIQDSESELDPEFSDEERLAHVRVFNVTMILTILLLLLQTVGRSIRNPEVCNLHCLFSCLACNSHLRVRKHCDIFGHFSPAREVLFQLNASCRV